MVTIVCPLTFTPDTDRLTAPRQPVSVNAPAVWRLARSTVLLKTTTRVVIIDRWALPSWLTFTDWTAVVRKFGLPMWSSGLVAKVPGAPVKVLVPSVQAVVAEPPKTPSDTSQSEEVDPFDSPRRAAYPGVQVPGRTTTGPV